MGTIFAEYTPKRNSIVVYTSTMGIFLITRMMTKMTMHIVSNFSPNATISTFSSIFQFLHNLVITFFI